MVRLTTQAAPPADAWDGQNSHSAAEELEPAASGGNVLVVARTVTEVVAQFVVPATEPGG